LETANGARCIRVVIADDHPTILLRMVQNILSGKADIELVGEAIDSVQAVTQFNIDIS
jgi:DNA-binding NarL/FixJ family response regulator